MQAAHHQLIAPGVMAAAHAGEAYGVAVADEQRIEFVVAGRRGTGTLERAEEIYRERHSTPEGKIAASFEIVYLTGWAPHASQQKPLAPGSAKQRLADALHTTEHSAGEKDAFPVKGKPQT